jgi:glycosyltransferase involved in cell wall biosynthesis
MVSIIIPSYKDPLLHKTINSLLENARGEIEIIVCLDGYWTNVIDDPRVHVIHHGIARGMREAINSGVRLAKGKYIMRTDEHCTFDEGYDTILSSTCEENWIVTPKRYFLDTDKWEIMDKPPCEFAKLIIMGEGRERKFSGLDWRERDEEMKDVMIGETMGMQGSCWLMQKSWWDKIGELESDGYGTHYQDSHEMIFKTWKLGGKMMLNKNTSYAHKHRKFPRTHGYGGEAARDGWAYCLKTWEDYYTNEIKPKWGI